MAASAAWRQSTWWCQQHARGAWRGTSQGARRRIRRLTQTFGPIMQSGSRISLGTGRRTTFTTSYTGSYTG
ncbi:hypothetical protein [Nonomuraea basaltis]|uniref:hypothetical protein n=1 Tax=Nonomuraea basaltis TaxID=2495887 RepID=UPI00110C4F04|nr:hypothetical protein [Nonomuraea basaltis]TMR90079.1 hypothetical protein EJK15_57265 [Nonomuraea basaltis]